MKAPTLSCPICDRKITASDDTSLPFCSERCRQIDLRRWLGEAYSVPVRWQSDEESDAETDPGS